VSDLILSRRELQVLTNCIYSSDRRYVQVSYPFYDLELFTLDMQKPELTHIIRPDDFDRARLQRKPTERGVSADELPSYSDFKDCLLSSNFLDYRNEGEIASKLVELKEESMDPNRRPRPVFVAVDTNILYFKFLSRHLPMKDEASGKVVDGNDFRYVLSEIVQLEIDSRIVHKYSRDEISALASLFAHKELIGELKNGSSRRGRIAKLAFNEMNYLMTELRALRIKGTPTKGKERNDIEIAQSYKYWARNADYDVFLLTADEDMVSHALASELMTMQLELPYDVPSHGRIDPWAVTDLLYDLAVTFGVISLDNEGTHLFGEWAGKTSTDYSRENLKAVLTSSEKHTSISRQLDVCRKILSQHLE
jgi:hypothetical protein